MTITKIETTESWIRERLEIEYGADNINSDSKLSDLGLDSLDEVEFQMEVEERFLNGNEIPSTEELETVQQYVAYVESHKGKYESH